jgi:hypothetical protein
MRKDNYKLLPINTKYNLILSEITSQTDEMKLYIDNTIRLAKSLVIKIEEVAEVMNTYLNAVYGYDAMVDNKGYYAKCDKDINYNLNYHKSIVDEREAWRYYKHLIGEYHYLDKCIEVISIDTFEVIYFTMDNLNKHPLTRKYYYEDENALLKLIQEYPEQEILIKCIVNPISLTMKEILAIDNYSILNYRHELVDTQEIFLMYELNNWVKMYQERWHVKAFVISDSLYLPAQLGILYLNIVPKILNIRMKYFRTMYMCNFYIKQYLASHGYLDKYYRFLTLEQQLWLCRNLAYIERHSGKKFIINQLFYNILKKRHIDLYVYTIEDLNTYNTVNCFPNIIATKYYFNTPDHDHVDIDEFLDMEELVAEGNPNFLRERFKKEAGGAFTSVIQTKVFQSIFYDYSNFASIDFLFLSIKQWGYLSYIGMYDTSIQINEPIQNMDSIISISDAFYLLIYLAYITSGKDVIKTDTIWFDDTFVGCEESIYALNNIYGKEIKRSTKARYIVDIFIESLSKIKKYNKLANIYQFNDYCKLVYDIQYFQTELVKSIKDIELHSIALTCYKACFQTIAIAGLPDMASILNKTGIPITEYADYSEYSKLLNQLIETGLQRTIDDYTNDELHTNLIRLFLQLSSYSIHVINSKNVKIDYSYLKKVRTGINNIIINNKINYDIEIYVNGIGSSIIHRQHGIVYREREFGINTNGYSKLILNHKLYTDIIGGNSNTVISSMIPLVIVENISDNIPNIDFDTNAISDLYNTTGNVNLINLQSIATHIDLIGFKYIGKSN